MQAGWEQSSEAIAVLCERFGSGNGVARALQTALVLLRLGLEGAGPGTMQRQPASPPDECRELAQLPEGSGVLKFITRLAPLCLKNCQDSISRLQRLVDEELVDSIAELNQLVGVMHVCTRFVVDACDCMVLHPEDWEFERCTSLHRILPLMECCLPTLDSALVLSSVARKLQVASYCTTLPLLACFVYSLTSLHFPLFTSSKQVKVEAQNLVEPLLGTYQAAMECLQGICAWLVDDYLPGVTAQVPSSLASPSNKQLLTERQGLSRVLSLVASLAKSHTADLRPGIINVAYKSLMRVLDTAVPLPPARGFWTGCFDGRELAASMLNTVDIVLGELFCLSAGGVIIPP